jgi:5-methylcytosine-specific restriction endonuclease McrA
MSDSAVTKCMDAIEWLIKEHGEIPVRTAIKLFNRRKRSVPDMATRRICRRWVKEGLYKKQKGVCPDCSGWFLIVQMEADHIIPLAHGGTNEESNWKLRCKKCNREKGSKNVIEQSKAENQTILEQMQ